MTKTIGPSVPLLALCIQNQKATWSGTLPAPAFLNKKVLFKMGDHHIGNVLVTNCTPNIWTIALVIGCWRGFSDVKDTIRIFLNFHRRRKTPFSNLPEDSSKPNSKSNKNNIYESRNDEWVAPKNQDGSEVTKLSAKFAGRWVRIERRMPMNSWCLVDTMNPSTLDTYDPLETNISILTL